MKKIKNDIGITLIALVITIIILLILTGITISSLTNQGLFKNAKEAKNRTESAQKEEQELLNQYEDELNKYTSKNENNNEDNEEEDNEEKIKIVDKVNDGTIKIGDYVKYTPDKTSTTEILQELGKYSGSSDNTTSTLTQENLNWRVLDVKDGQVRLISEVPTTSTITLTGYNGYNNSVKLIDDACRMLYTNSKLASKVQNLKRDNIEEKMIETNYSNITSDYGKILSPNYKYYPSILLKEKNQKVNATNGTELDSNEQTELIIQTGKLQASSLEVKYTYWNKIMVASDFKDSKYYELFINNGSDYPMYWLSSRCVYADTNCALFLAGLVYSSNIGGQGFYYSYDEERTHVDAFRPVITLNSDVLISTSKSGNGSTAEQAYVIK